jgi:hypothetical protein
MCCIGGVCRPQTWTFQSATAATHLYPKAPKQKCMVTYKLYTMSLWSRDVWRMDSEEKGSQKIGPTKLTKTFESTIKIAGNMFKLFYHAFCL